MQNTGVVQYRRRGPKCLRVTPAKLKACSLCSGVGGMDVSFKRAGFEIVMQCEIDPYCLEILAKNFGAPTHTDIRTMPFIPTGVHVILATFPCQNGSRRNRGGTRTGVEGLESGKIGELWRLLENETGPKVPYILMETVPGFLEKGDGVEPLILPVLKRLQEFGYSWAYREVSTMHLTGLPHDRKRLLILASRNRDACDILLAPLAVCSKHCTCVDCVRLADVQMYIYDPGERTNGPCAGRSPTITASNSSRLCVVDTYTNRISKLNALDLERLFGFPDQWSEPFVRSTDKSKNAVRLRVLGNSIPARLCDFVSRGIMDTNGLVKYVPNPNLGDKVVKLSVYGSMPPAAYGGGVLGAKFAMFTPGHLSKRKDSWRPESRPFCRLEDVVQMNIERASISRHSAVRYLEGLRKHRMELVPKLRRAFMRGAGVSVLEVCVVRPQPKDVVWADFGTRWVPPVWPVYLLRKNGSLIERIVGVHVEVWVHTLPHAAPSWVPKSSIISLSKGMKHFSMQRGRSKKKSVNVFAIDSNSNFKEAIDMAIEEHAFALEHFTEVDDK